MSNTELELLRQKADELNLQILKLINERGNVVKEIGKAKEAQGVNRFDPVRERTMLNNIIENNDGPFENSTIQHIFKEIFKAGLELQEEDHSKALLVSRKKKPEDTIVDIKGEKIGDDQQRFIVGPCAVESYEQVAEVAAAAKKQGIKILRGGAFKPRTSPYDFQGLGVEGLQILKRVADEFDLAVISEIVTPAHIEEALDYIDVIQIGARNMQNFELLKAAGAVKKPCCGYDNLYLIGTCCNTVVDYAVCQRMASCLAGVFVYLNLTGGFISDHCRSDCQNVFQKTSGKSRTCPSACFCHWHRCDCLSCRQRQSGKSASIGVAHFFSCYPA